MTRVVYNRGMRTLIITTNDTLPKGYCVVRVHDGTHTLFTCDRVRYGLPITNIMEEWECTRLRYGATARRLFLNATTD